MAARRLIVGATATLALSVAGCASGGYPPAAEPAVSPPLARVPAGRTFRVGTDPEGVVVDPRTRLAAVITREPYELRVVDLSKGKVVQSSPLPSKGRHLALAPSSGSVLVPAEDANQLVEVSLPGGGERRIEVGEHPHDAVAAAGRIFVGNEFGNSVSVVEGGAVATTLDAPTQPGGVAAAGSYLAVVAVAERVLTVYDLRSLERLAETPAGIGPTHVVADGRRAWVADTGGNAILEFELGPDPRQIARLAVPGAPYGMALDATRDRLWVSLTARNVVVGYDVSRARPREVARYPVLRQPNTLAVDPRSGHVVVTGVDSGKLEVLPGASG